MFSEIHIHIILNMQLLFLGSMKVYLFNFKTGADPRGQAAPNSKLFFAVKIAAPYAILENGSGRSDDRNV